MERLVKGESSTYVSPNQHGLLIGGTLKGLTSKTI